MTTSVPMANDTLGFERLVPEGFQFAPGKDNATVLAARVDEQYFDTLGLTLLRGRNFSADDSFDRPRVAIVNQPFAQHYWPNQDPIGKRFQTLGDEKEWVQVVGLAKTSKYIFIAEAPVEFVYFPHRQKKLREMTLLAQSQGDAGALAAPLREMVRGLDPNMPIYNVRTMEQFYQMRAISIFRVLVSTVAGMGAMGLGLAIVGLYGLVSYAAARRTREIGIRMAIGADRGAVSRMMLRQGAVLAVVGLMIGLAGSVGAGELLRAAFPGDDQRDGGALLIVIPIVLSVTLLAAYIPAWRASRLNPVQALRHD
jgi:predicted permease